MTGAAGVHVAKCFVFLCVCVFFVFLSRPSSALISWSFTPGGPFGHLLCRGLSQCPFFIFPTRWLWWGLNPRPSDYQADVLPPDHPAPLTVQASNSFRLFRLNSFLCFPNDI